MLTLLQVRNFALIDHLELIFGDGLNILTGETGAGKSIIIDALGVALGERASAEMIRSGTDKLSVEAHFSLTNAPSATINWLLENCLENEDDPNLLVLAREVAKSGKSQSRINGRLVTTSLLRTVGRDLVDVHGQHEHQSLLTPQTHIDLLDNWLGEDVMRLRKAASDAFSELSVVRKELGQQQTDSRERARNLDLYLFQQKEIKDADLQTGEQELLQLERTRLTNSERLQLVADDGYTLLNQAAGDSINQTLAALSKVVDLDPELALVVEQLLESAAYLEEAIGQLRRYRDALDKEPGRLETVDDRLNLIHLLQRKYGSTVDEVITYGAELEQKIYAIEDGDASESKLVKRTAELELELAQWADALSAKRRAGAALFSESIITELGELGMTQTAFVASVVDQPLTARGSDRVEFLVSTNPGEPPRPLARIASGGETSRLMLAIKSVLARSSPIPTMIFDEIDTGIGGRTGRVIADKLTALSQIAQVLCITHLPQIASRPAAAHFSIEKTVSGGRTSVLVVPLSQPERELEIARMLGGESSQTVLQHAREMLSAR